MADDNNGDGITGDTAIAVLAVNPDKPSDQQIRVQVRKLSDNALIANWHFLNANWTAIALEAVDRSSASPLLAVLAHKASTGMNVVQARRLSDGVVQRDTGAWDASWVAQDLAIVNDANGDGNSNDPAYLVLAFNPDNVSNKVQALRVSDGAQLKNVPVLGSNWRATRVTGSGDLSGNLHEEVGVLGERRIDGLLLIHMVDYEDRTNTAVIFP